MCALTVDEFQSTLKYKFSHKRILQVSERRNELYICYAFSNSILEIQARGLYRRRVGVHEIFCTEPLPTNIHGNDPVKLAVDYRCVVVAEDRVYSDPFGSIPLYYIKDQNTIKLSSSPERLVKYSDRPFDPVGVWECLLYGASLWTRTPFKNLFQLPAAAKLLLVQAMHVERYSVPALSARASNHDPSSLVEELDAKIYSLFEMVRGKKIVIGLSGGIDCRLALLYLKEIVGDPSLISTFTFASNMNSHEIRFAKETCQVIGLAPPNIFILSPRHYKEASQYLPFWTAGQISNIHGHICEFLRVRDISAESIHLSTYYSDAIFGWACEDIQMPLSVGMSDSLSRLRSAPSISTIITSVIEEDLNKAMGAAVQNGNLSCLGEYQYIMERHPKFHMQLAFCQSQFHPTILPFANHSLLCLSQQLPLGIRGKKRIVDLLLARRNPKILKIQNSSSREYFYGSKSFLLNRGLTGKMQFMRFKGLNLISNLLARIPWDTLEYSSPFQTENLYKIYVQHFHNELLEILGDRRLTTSLAIDFEYQSQLRKIGMRDSHMASRFGLIDIARLHK